MATTDALKSVSTRKTPQRQKARPDQIENTAGGFVFQISDIDRLRRFLTLGVDGGTYYASAQTLARENAELVIRMAKIEPTVLVDTVVEVSSQGRAPKNNPALFALAIAASESSDDGKQ